MLILTKACEAEGMTNCGRIRQSRALQQEDNNVDVIKRVETCTIAIDTACHTQAQRSVVSRVRLEEGTWIVSKSTGRTANNLESNCVTSVAV